MPPLKLEVFDAFPRGGGGLTAIDTSEIEEIRLTAFESGYKAGWDDAVAALSDTEAELKADVARSLQGLAFTYHEARSHVLRALSPLIADVAARLLPQIAHAALPYLVAEALGPYAEIAAEAPIHVMVNPAARQRVEVLIGATPGLPLRLHDDPALTPGQVWLRLGDTETRVDIDAALATIRTALDDFFEHAAKDTRHG